MSSAEDDVEEERPLVRFGQKSYRPLVGLIALFENPLETTH